jgi:hypothetical protein
MTTVGMKTARVEHHVSKSTQEEIFRKIIPITGEGRPQKETHTDFNARDFRLKYVEDNEKFVSSNQWHYRHVHANADDEYKIDIIFSKRNVGEDLQTSAQRKQKNKKKHNKDKINNLHRTNT